MKKDTRTIVIICLILICTSVFLFYRKQNSTVSTTEFLTGENHSLLAADASDKTKTKDAEDSQAENPDSENQIECAVYISGAVKHPGLFRYCGTARLNDAIEALGGFTKNASKDSVNLARLLIDGEQIHILTKKQAKLQKKEWKSDLPDNVQTGNLININQATKEELLTLPGIGEAKADLIIRYRTEHGMFSKPEDIMQISGIKDGIYNKIKDYITI